MVFGEVVEGYSQRVLNEREARAAAGILFLFGMLSFLNSFMLGNFIFTQYFVGFFMFDFLIRILNPKYSPSLLLGRFFIQNQIPEYVGASQKRFAWSIGFVLSTIMFYLVVLDPQMNPIKIVICILCLMLLISESAFSICLGCKIYNVVKKDTATNCPGGVCEMTTKEPIQTFNLLQKVIVSILSISIVAGLYTFSVDTPNYSSAMKMMPMMMISEEDRIKMLEEADLKRIEAEFSNDEEEEEIVKDKDCIVPQYAIDMGHEKMWKEKHCKSKKIKKTTTAMKCGAGKCGGGK